MYSDKDDCEYKAGKDPIRTYRPKKESGYAVSSSSELRTGFPGYLVDYPVLTLFLFPTVTAIFTLTAK